MIDRTSAARIYGFLSRYFSPLVPAARLAYYAMSDRRRLRLGLSGTSKSKEIRGILHRLQELAREPGAMARNYCFDDKGELSIGSAYGALFAYIPQFGLRFLELNGTNDRVQLEFVLRNIPDDAVVFDVGASYGYYSITIGVMKKQARVFSFEPSSLFFSYLTKNIALNKLAERVEAMNAAAGRAVGSGQAVLNDIHVEFVRDAGEASTAEAASGQSVKIDTIDNVVKQRGLDRLDYIKADVEGAELMVLQGATESIKRFRPIIQLELADTFTLPRFGYSIKTIFDMLAGADYTYLLLPKEQVALESGPLRRATDPNQDMTASSEFFFVPREREGSIDLASGVRAVAYPYVTLRLDKRGAD